MIKSRLALLIAEQHVERGKKLTYRALAADAGVSVGVVARLMAGTPDRLDTGSLDALCRYFECSVCDVLQYVPDAPTEAQESHTQGQEGGTE